MKIPTKNKRGFVWLFKTGDSSNDSPVVYFKYAGTRAQHIPDDFLQGFNGILQVDGYGGYNNFRRSENVIVAGCASHARRKFADVLMLTPKQAQYAVIIINAFQELFTIEQLIKHKTNDQKQEYREQYALPIWKSMKEKCERFIQMDNINENTKSACNYLLQFYDELTVYVHHGHVDICNNSAERHIRPVACGRRNFGKCDTERGADALAIHYTLVETCKARGVNPYGYYCYLLKNIQYAKTQEDFEKLVPGCWGFENNN